MRSFICLAIILLWFSNCTGNASAVKNTNAAVNDSDNIIVLELFTSQGCSSCPPADRLLGKLATHKNIAALSFHVDYWNRLGWTDPFSDQLYSERQEQYSRRFGAGGVYTPQLVINGNAEMVGSDEERVNRTIKALSNNQTVTLTTEAKGAGNNITISVIVKGDHKNATLNIALVQNKAITPVKAGENEGLVLTNFNVVRKFTVIPVKMNNISALLQLPDGLSKEDCSVIVFLQMGSGKIVAAGKCSIS